MSDYKNEPCPFDGLELPEFEPPKDLKEHIFRAVAEELVKDAAAPQPRALELVSSQADTELTYLMGTAKRYSLQEKTRFRSLLRGVKQRMPIAASAGFILLGLLGWAVSRYNPSPPWIPGKYLNTTPTVAGSYTRQDLFHELNYISFTRLGTWDVERTRSQSFKTISIPAGIRSPYYSPFTLDRTSMKLQDLHGPVALFSTDGNMMLTSHASQYCLWKLESNGNSRRADAQPGGDGVQAPTFKALINPNATMLLTIDGQNLRAWKLTSADILDQRNAWSLDKLLSPPAEPCNLLTLGTPHTG